MYPNLIRIDREQIIFRTQKQSQVRLHPSCTLYDLNPQSTGRLAKKQMIGMLPTDWLVFEEMLMTGMIASARTVTVVTPLTVLLMAGPTRLPLHAISTSVTDNGEDYVHGSSNHLNVFMMFKMKIKCMLNNEILKCLRKFKEHVKYIPMTFMIIFIRIRNTI